MTNITLKGPEDQSVIFNVDPNDLIGRRVLKSHNWYEYPLLLDIFKRTRYTYGTAIDVGAGPYGIHSLWMSLCCHLKVVAFEPNLDSYNRLFDNKITNNANIYALHCAAGDYSGVGKVIPPKEGNFGTSAFTYRSGGTTAVYPIDYFNIQDAVVVKIDIEEEISPGSLKAVLEGAKNTIENSRPLLYIEGSEDLIQSLLPSYYKCFGRFGKTDLYGFKAEDES